MLVVLSKQIIIWPIQGNFDFKLQKNFDQERVGCNIPVCCNSIIYQII